MKNKKIILLVMLSLFIGFVMIAAGVVVDAAWIQRLDQMGNQLFRLDISHEATELIFRITHIGSIRTLTFTALAIGGFLLFKKKFLGFLWLAISMPVIGGLTPWFLKYFFARPRPTDGLMSRGGYSFPSGHTMGTLALYGLVIILAVVYLQKSWQRQTVIIASLGVILLISWSRVHLGVHFLTDIIGSVFLGVALLLGASLALSGLHRKLGKD